MSDSKKKVVVNVAPRQGFPGYYSAQEFWPNGITYALVVPDEAAKKAAQQTGSTERYVTEAQLGELLSETRVLSVLSPEQAAAQVHTGAVVLNDEERALVEAHRAKKATKSADAPKK